MRMKATGFDTQVAERLEIGAREYGDRSYSRPLRDLLVEMTEECADIAAWGSIALAAHPDDAEAEGSDPLRGALRPPSVAAAAERDRAHGMGSVSATDKTSSSPAWRRRSRTWTRRRCARWQTRCGRTYSTPSPSPTPC